MSATPDSTLADPQQIIADLQRKLNEAEAERDGALAQQTATAEVLGVINSSGAISHRCSRRCSNGQRGCAAPDSARFGFTMANNFAQPPCMPCQQRSQITSTNQCQQGIQQVFLRSCAAKPSCMSQIWLPLSYIVPAI